MTDIVERLREVTVLEDYGDGHRLVRWAHPLGVEAADEIERLREAFSNLKSVFRVNMLRAFPETSHEVIDAYISKALGETE